MGESDYDGDCKEDEGNTEHGKDENTSKDEDGNDEDGDGENGNGEDGDDKDGNGEEYDNDDNGDKQDHEEYHIDQVNDDDSCKDQKAIVLSFESSLPTLCAYELLFRFLRTVISDELFLGITGDGDLQEDSTSKSWKKFRLKNDDITSLAQKIKESGLMSFEHALLYVVATLSHAEKPPDCPGVLEHLNSRAVDFKSRRQFAGAAQIYEWLVSYSKHASPRMETWACALSFVFHEQLVEIISIMQEEAPLAGDQQAAKAEIDSAKGALNRVRRALNRISYDIIQKSDPRLRNTYRRLSRGLCNIRSAKLGSAPSSRTDAGRFWLERCPLFRSQGPYQGRCPRA
jgi:hypothetical protein